MREKIVSLTSAGVRRLPEMRRHLRAFVCDDLFLGQAAPPQSDARFWPSSRTTLNCMYQTSLQLRFDYYEILAKIRCSLSADLVVVVGIQLLSNLY